jgi:hypothetical protein
MKARPAACTASGEICMVVGGPSLADGGLCGGGSTQSKLRVEDNVRFSNQC